MNESQRRQTTAHNAAAATGRRLVREQVRLNERCVSPNERTAGGRQSVSRRPVMNECMCVCETNITVTIHQHMTKWWLGLVVMALDLRLDGHEFDSRRPRLWATVFGQANQLGYPDQLSLLPSVGREMSTGQSAVILLCGWGVKAGMAHFNCG